MQKHMVNVLLKKKHATKYKTFKSENANIKRNAANTTTHAKVKAQASREISQFSSLHLFNPSM